MPSPSLADSILLSQINPSRNLRKKYLIVFITGNPGLIEYYRAFLTHLYSLLDTPGDTAYDIYGSSIPGFDFNDSSRYKELGLTHAPPFSLDEVIDAVERDVWRIVGKSEYEGVIIMGHSLGSYITLEIIQRHRRRLEKAGSGEVRVVGGICLFPTVMDIAKSERGKVLTTLTNLPFFQSLIPLLCSFLLALLPRSLINYIVHRIDGLTGHAAEATTAFLKSHHGVTQALTMGKDEMLSISTDKWNSEIWGAAHPSATGTPRPKLFFYFGERDHWVADRTRADLMLARGRRGMHGGTDEEWKPRMEVDDMGVPHGFCISHSIPVAEKVKGYVQEIVEYSGEGERKERDA